VNWLKRRSTTEWLVIAVLILASTCFILAIRGGPGVGDSFTPSRATARVAPSTDNPITSIRLQAALKPARVRVGQRIRIAVLASVVGGPAPVTFAAKIPDQYGSTYTGSITTMIDHNGTYGFETPPMEVDMSPGVYSYTVRASSGAASVVRTVVLTVDPDPTLFVP